MERINIVFFTGAGVSRESGIPTFRDEDGLWEGHDVRKVADIRSWNSKFNRKENRELILEFYNQRRRDLHTVKPNLAHKAIGLLEKDPRFNVQVITQNVDNLHERGGSTQVTHLHGELLKARGTLNPETPAFECTGDIRMGDKCEDGSQIRPAIVWFGEEVPEMANAARILANADVLVVCGTSLEVYPAAGVFDYIPNECTRYIVDPNIPDKKLREATGTFCFDEVATVGIDKVIKHIEETKHVGIS